MDPIFKKKPEGVKVYFTTSELESKPIIFWNNSGNIDENSTFSKWIKSVRSLVGVRTINTISHLTYYAGGKILFPFHCNWMGDMFEFSLFDPHGNHLLNFSRKVDSKDETFKREEIHFIKKHMEIHSHMMTSAYELFKDEKFDNYNEVFKHKKLIKFILNEYRNKQARKNGNWDSNS